MENKRLMDNMLNRLLIIILMIFCVSACTSNPNYSLYKTHSPINYVELNNSHRMIQRGVEADISNWFFLYLPAKLEVGTDTVIADKLSDRILKKYNGDILTNVEIKKDTLITLYWNYYSYSMTADVWSRK